MSQVVVICLTYHYDYFYCYFFYADPLKQGLWFVCPLLYPRSLKQCLGHCRLWKKSVDWTKNSPLLSSHYPTSSPKSLSFLPNLLPLESFSFLHLAQVSSAFPHLSACSCSCEPRRSPGKWWAASRCCSSHQCRSPFCSGVGDRDACSCSFGGGSRKTVRQRASSHLLEQAYWRSRGGSKATRTSQPEKQGYLRRFFNKVKPSVQSVSSRHKNT